MAEGKRNRLVAGSLCFYETSEPGWMSIGPYVSMNAWMHVTSHTVHRVRHTLKSVAEVMLIHNFHLNIFSTEPHL